jgi:elongation factor P hydroxylase
MSKSCHVAQLAVTQSVFRDVELHYLAHDHVFAFVKTVTLFSLCDVLSKKEDGPPIHQKSHNQLCMLLYSQLCM